MNDSISPQTPISVEEILKTEIVLNQALIDILFAKRIISEEELISSIQNIKQEQQKLFQNMEE